jgi:hypothetical protein
MKVLTVSFPLRLCQERRLQFIRRGGSRRLQIDGGLETAAP